MDPCFIYCPIRTRNSIFRIKCGKAYSNGRAGHESFVSPRSSSRIVSAVRYVPHVIRTIFFVPCIPIVCRVGVIFSGGKSTFRTQNDTDKAYSRCTADKKSLLARFNSSKYRSESSTRCCFWSGVGKRGTRFENNLRIPKDSSKIVNTLPSDIFKVSTISRNFNLRSPKTI